MVNEWCVTHKQFFLNNEIMKNRVKFVLTSKLVNIQIDTHPMHDVVYWWTSKHLNANGKL